MAFAGGAAVPGPAGALNIVAGSGSYCERRGRDGRRRRWRCVCCFWSASGGEIVIATGASDGAASGALTPGVRLVRGVKREGGGGVRGQRHCRIRRPQVGDR